jgi:hypothetical protein
MKINKEIRRLSREMLRASFTDGQLDLEGLRRLSIRLSQKNRVIMSRS